MNNYEYGFITKCAEYGVDPEKIIKFAQSYNTYEVQDGDTLSEIAYSRGIPLKILLEENGIASKDANKIRVGQSLKIPNYSSKKPVVQKTVAIGQRVPEREPWIWRVPKRVAQNIRYDDIPFTSLIKEAPRTLVNRGARKVTKDPNYTLWHGGTTTSLGATQDEIIRQLIIEQNDGKIPMSGSFGGKRPGKPYDDYRNSLHNEHAYAGGSGSLGNLANKTFNPYNRIENTLGDAQYYIDENGDLIVTDVYDFNTNEGRNGKGTYGRIRRDIAPAIAPTDKEPIEGKTKYKINLGNPETWERRPEFMKKVREGTKGNKAAKNYLTRFFDVGY